MGLALMMMRMAFMGCMLKIYTDPQASVSLNDKYLPHQANMMSRMKMMSVSNYEYQSVDKYLTCQANMMTDPSQTLDTLRLILQVA